MSKTRRDGRAANALRPVRIETGLQANPEGSVLYRCGGTLVLVSASVEEGVRDFLRGQGKGWVTAEYAMHPRANPTRQSRDGRRGPIDGRSQEIQRLIARALRAAIVPEKLGERTITIDCDVLDADGGTRTASITAGWIALVMALESLRKRGLVGAGVLRSPVSAVSVGLVGGTPLLDLNYLEDRDAQVDLNVVATARGDIVEIQGTAEDAPMTRKELDALTDLALGAVPELAAHQAAQLAKLGIDPSRLAAS